MAAEECVNSSLDMERGEGREDDREVQQRHWNGSAQKKV